MARRNTRRCRPVRRRRARPSHQAARAHARDARGGRPVGPASLKHEGFLLPRQRVATRLVWEWDLDRLLRHKRQAKRKPKVTRDLREERGSRTAPPRVTCALWLRRLAPRYVLRSTTRAQSSVNCICIFVFDTVGVLCAMPLPPCRVRRAVRPRLSGVCACTVLAIPVPGL